MNNRLVQKSKRLLSGIVATAIATSMLPTLPAVAEKVKNIRIPSLQAQVQKVRLLLMQEISALTVM